MAKNILLLNGPNLNLLGTREPKVYGTTTLGQVVQAAELQVSAAGGRLSHLQSNHEGVLIDCIHHAVHEQIDFIVINPGGLTHTSVALRDALAGVAIDFIELHISNIHRREKFRQHSFLSDIALGVICGCGVEGYRLALDFALHKD